MEEKHGCDFVFGFFSRVFLYHRFSGVTRMRLDVCCVCVFIVFGMCWKSQIDS